MIKLTNIAKNFLSEAKKGHVGRSKPISIEQAKSLLRKDCSKYDINHDTPIFRGIKSTVKQDYMFVDPSKHTRTSANTKNYYTLLVDHSSRWKNYPKRSKSIICSASPNEAEGYGTVYRVIPFDGSKIGIAPNSDFWASFLEINTKIGSLAQFNRALEIIIRELLYISANDNKKDFFGALDELEEKYGDKSKEEIMNSALTRSLARYGEFIVDKWASSNDTFRETLEKLLDPKKNDFRLETWPTSYYVNTNEMWTDGPCILVKEYSNAIKNLINLKTGKFI